MPPIVLLCGLVLALVVTLLARLVVAYGDHKARKRIAREMQRLEPLVVVGSSMGYDWRAPAFGDFRPGDGRWYAGNGEWES